MLTFGNATSAMSQPFGHPQIEDYVPYYPACGCDWIQLKLGDLWKGGVLTKTYRDHCCNFQIKASCQAQQHTAADIELTPPVSIRLMEGDSCLRGAYAKPALIITEAGMRELSLFSSGKSRDFEYTFVGFLCFCLCVCIDCTVLIIYLG